MRYKHTYNLFMVLSTVAFVAAAGVACTDVQRENAAIKLQAAGEAAQAIAPATGPNALWVILGGQLLQLIAQGLTHRQLVKKD